MVFAHKLLQVYGVCCQPICQELGVPQTAFDILMFLANNPDYQTARDIVEIRGIKANLVSVNVEKLVQDGYLKREPVWGDRRKVRLVCMEKAQPIIEAGRRIQASFFEEIFREVDQESRREFCRVVAKVQENLDQMRERQGQ